MSEQDSQIDDQGTMPLLEHLAELRNRLGICVAVFVVLFIGCLVPGLSAATARAYRRCRLSVPAAAAC